MILSLWDWGQRSGLEMSKGQWDAALVGGLDTALFVGLDDALGGLDDALGGLDNALGGGLDDFCWDQILIAEKVGRKRKTDETKLLFWFFKSFITYQVEMGITLVSLEPQVWFWHQNYPLSAPQLKMFIFLGSDPDRRKGQKEKKEKKLVKLSCSFDFWFFKSFLTYQVEMGITLVPLEPQVWFWHQNDPLSAPRLKLGLRRQVRAGQRFGRDKGWPGQRFGRDKGSVVKSAGRDKSSAGIVFFFIFYLFAWLLRSFFFVVVCTCVLWRNFVPWRNFLNHRTFLFLV